jgi:DNA-binding FadR family transcriptional regulator
MTGAMKLSARLAAALRQEMSTASEPVVVSEGALIERFGVSRPTVREAVRILVSEGLATVARGPNAGITLRPPDAETAALLAWRIMAAQGVAVEEVLRLRAALETEMLRQIIVQRDRGRLTALKAAFEAESERFEESGDIVAEGIHEVLLAPTDPVLAVPFAALRDIVVGEASAVSITGATPATRLNFRRAHAVHGDVVALAESGDAERACDLWHRHVTRVNRTYARLRPVQSGPV